jgi:hypothetical protein
MNEELNQGLNQRGADKDTTTRPASTSLKRFPGGQVAAENARS